MEIAKCITKIRKAKGYSQTEIAEMLQTTQQQYSKYETGKQEIPARIIKKLSEFYNIQANKLLGIEIYMTEEDKTNSFYRSIEATRELIDWAEYQEHITEDARNILQQNITRIQKTIEEEI